MKKIITKTFKFSCLLSFVFITSYAQAKSKMLPPINVIAIYQLEDEEDASFDFFSSKKMHKCGGKASNRFRSYSDNDNITRRKFDLVISAINFKHTLSLRTLGCEGRAMLVDTIGLKITGDHAVNNVQSQQ